MSSQLWLHVPRIARITDHVEMMTHAHVTMGLVAWIVLATSALSTQIHVPIMVNAEILLDVSVTMVTEVTTVLH